jgi:hypothetical protein
LIHQGIDDIYLRCASPGKINSSIRSGLDSGWEKLLYAESGGSTQCCGPESLSKITTISETCRPRTNSSGGRSA